MEIEHVHNGIRYTLSNENHKLGDKVYPIAMGRCRDDGSWVLHGFHWKDFMSGFPEEPHEIIDFIAPYPYTELATYREIRTNHGSSPEYCYYKIIKKEQQIREGDRMFATYRWIEIQ